MQWFLSSENLDIAIVCKDAAKTIVEKDKSLLFVSPLIKNSDVILSKDGKNNKIGLIENKDYQEEIAKKIYLHAKFIKFPGTYIGYAMENGNIDSVMLDGFKAITAKGKKEATNKNGDYVSYVLVANKEFIKNNNFKKFIELYNKSVAELKNESNFKKFLESYINSKIDNKQWGEIKSWKIQFMEIKD